MTPPPDDIQTTADAGQPTDHSPPADQSLSLAPRERGGWAERRRRLPLSVLHAALDILAEEWETDL